MAETTGGLFPTFRRVLRYDIRGVGSDIRNGRRHRKWLRELRDGKLSELEQLLAGVIFPEFESESAALVLGVDQLAASEIVDPIVYLRCLADALSQKGATPADAAKGAFYLSISPEALATLVERLIEQEE